MRKNQRWLMLLIAILTIVAFAFLYSTSEIEQLAANKPARIYGKDLTMTELRRGAGKFDLALALGLTDYANSLDRTGGAEGPTDFIFNTIVVEHEGERLGIVPTDNEIKDAIMALPSLQKGGQFDPEKYKQVVLGALASRGFTEMDVQEIIKNSLVLKRIESILDTVPTASDAEVTFMNRGFQPATGEAIVFDRSAYLEKARLTEEEINAYYTVNQPRYYTPEWRTVRYVSFDLPEEAKTLEGKDKIAAQQKLADQADAFVDAALNSGFDNAARSAGLTVKSTLPFTREGRVKATDGLSEADTEAIAGPVRILAPTAFTLSSSSPISSVVADGDNFLVAELGEVTPTEQMTLEQARPEIVEEMRALDAQRLLEEAADEAFAKIREALKAGKPFAEAAQAAGVKTVPFTDIEPLGDSGDDTLRAYADASTSIKEGEISGFFPSATGGFAVYLAQRAPVDKTAFEEREPQIRDYILARKRSILFYEWLIGAREKAGLIVNPG